MVKDIGKSEFPDQRGNGQSSDREIGASFSRLDAAAGHGTSVGTNSLDIWYRQVSSMPIAELPSSDVARALRQRIHVEHVALRALELLREDPLAGDLYAGELLLAFAQLPAAHLNSLPATPRVQVLRLASDLLARGPAEHMDLECWEELREALDEVVSVLDPNPKRNLRLVAARGSEAPVAMPLAAGEAVTLGTAPDVTLRFPPGAGLARHHAAIKAHQDGAHVELFGHSARLNGALAPDAFELRPGDQLELVDLRIHLETGGGVTSGSERLDRLGLGHLANDLPGLKAELKRRADAQRASERRWDEEQRRWLKSWAASTAHHTDDKAMPDLSSETLQTHPSFLDPTENDTPFEPPSDAAAVLASWDYLCEIAPPPIDLDPATQVLLDSLWDAVGLMIDDPARAGQAEKQQHLKASAERLRSAVRGRRLRPESALAVLLGLADAIIAGALSRGAKR